MRYSYVPESHAAHEAQIAKAAGLYNGSYEALGKPIVPARPPRGPHEFADKRQAGTLGRLAIPLGWRVRPLYAKGADGLEICVLRLARGPLRAVATWHRPPGADGWSADVAYAWRIDVEAFPANVGVQGLSKLIKELGLPT